MGKENRIRNARIITDFFGSYATEHVDTVLSKALNGIFKIRSKELESLKGNDSNIEKISKGLAKYIKRVIKNDHRDRTEYNQKVEAIVNGLLKVECDSKETLDNEDSHNYWVYKTNTLRMEDFIKHPSNTKLYTVKKAPLPQKTSTTSSTSTASSTTSIPLNSPRIVTPIPQHH